MGLNLKELVELAALDSVMDHPVTLDKLMAAGTPWHELSGRSDVRALMGAVIMRIIDNGLIVVCELHEGQVGAPLESTDAVMVFERASNNPGTQPHVQVSITDSGKTHYKQLAHRYYNG